MVDGSQGVQASLIVKWLDESHAGAMMMVHKPWTPQQATQTRTEMLEKTSGEHDSLSMQAEQDYPKKDRRAVGC